MGAVIDDHDVTVWQGDARTILGELPAGSVQCIVTSPPYYGLRDYGTGTWDGGDPNCDHSPRSKAAIASSGLQGATTTTGGNAAYRDVCGKCGASRGDQQIGLEASPAEYVEQLRAVFAEARRVLTPDGVLFLNLGDSYAGGSWGAQGKSPQGLHTKVLEARGYAATASRTGAIRDGMPPAKNLLGMPWRTAFALQDDGWYLRNDIIWSKPNAMPESVTDRLSTRHEHVFLFTRSRRYSFNLDAIREPHSGAHARPGDTGQAKQTTRTPEPGRFRPVGRNSGLDVRKENPLGRNPGDVWSIPTSPTPYAHFATMPPELARRCILAGCAEGGTVLDPFAGSGTTLMVARQLGRRAVGVELNPKDVDIIRRRIGQEPLNFDEAAVI